MVELSQQAEKAGLDSVWMADGYYAHDPLVSLAAIASATDKVTVGTSVSTSTRVTSRRTACDS